MTFYDCLMECSVNVELINQFNRLNNCKLGMRKDALTLMVDKATGHVKDDEFAPFYLDDATLRKFIVFVYDYVWLTAPAEVRNG